MLYAQERIHTNAHKEQYHFLEVQFFNKQITVI